MKNLLQHHLKVFLLKKIVIYNYSEYFEVIVCGDMIENSKPAPDIYLKASELLGVTPSECLALEDSPNGIKSAFSAQFKPVMIPDLIQPTEEILEMVHSKLVNLSEVIDLLIYDSNIG